MSKKAAIPAIRAIVNGEPNTKTAVFRQSVKLSA
jgi:hypothetical protein